VILSILVVLGLGFRAYGLSKEGLSDDELNRYNAVEDYRQHGVTSANGEHPMLMKALITLSLVAADHWNSTQIAQSHPDELRISIETAVRLPSIVFGALTSLAIYFLVLELFGTDVALIAAALWAFDPSAIGFGRIGKEDTFVLFFFVLANVFWLRGQRIAELKSNRNPEPYYWATAAAYGAMIASQRFQPAGFALPLGQKDNRLMLEAAESLGVPLPLASLVHDRFLAARARGFRDLRRGVGDRGGRGRHTARGLAQRGQRADFGRE